MKKFFTKALALVAMLAMTLSVNAQCCDFETGHENNPSFGDANGRILLSIEPTGNANEYKLTIKPNKEAGNVKNLDYLYVIGSSESGNISPYPATAGTDESSNEEELSTVFTCEGTKASFTIQWSYPDWAGRWQCAPSDIALGDLVACAGGAPKEIYDTNFALASNGSSATASSGTAANAIDGNEGTRWESAATDDETWTLDMGQLRIFNTIKILWEGAYAKQFTLTYSTDGVNYSPLYTEENLTQAGWQFIELEEKVTAQYIKYHGTQRATQWGQSFYEFQVLLPNVSVLTSIHLTTADKIAKVDGAGVALTATAKDQNNKTMEAEISWEITPADAGSVVDGKYIPAKIGNASIVAYNGEVRSAAVEIFGVSSDNLALSTNIDTDNKVIAQSDFAPSGTNAFFAVDGNEGSVWQGSATNGTAGDDEARTYDSWFVVDLGGKYTIDLITIKFEGACSQLYHIDFSEDNTAWTLGYNYIGAAGVNGRTDYLSTQLDNNQKVRYVRFWSTKAATEWGMKMFELKVFGREYVPSGDTEKPVMVSATLDSKTWNSVVIAVDATDNDEVAKYHVVNADPAIDVKLAATDGKITINGLTAETAYNFTITAIDAANNESENSKSVEVTTNVRVIVPTTAAPVPEWPAAQVKSLYSDTYEFAPASLVSYNEGWWDNPNMTQEAIGEDHYLHYDLYRNGMIGAQFAEISVLNMEKVHIDIFASAAGSVTFRPITVDGPNTPKTLNLQAEQWNSFDIDMSDFTGHDWSKLFQFAIEGYNAGGLVGEHISVDNVYLYRTTEQQDEDAPTSVTAEMASASYFSVVLAVSAEDNSGAVSYVVKNGEIVVANGAGASGATVNITVNGLTPNTEYSFKVIAKDEKENAADPVAVAVKTLAAPAAAPAPALSGLEKVVPVFTDAQAGGPAIAIGGWGQSTKAQVVELAENDEAYYLTNMNYLGWELTPAVDATGTTHLHVDFYTTNLTKVSVTPISPGKEGASVVDLTAGEWNSVEIPLSDYDGKEIVWNNIFQFKFMDATPAGGELFIDNVYFYEPKATAIDNNVEAVKAVKVIENGQLIIIKNGIRYNVAGQMVK